jgi:hypothetical protein
MKSRLSLIALVAAVSLPAMATSGFTPSTGEAGGTPHAMPSIKTRAQVLQELQEWQRNPVTADGWREVGGDAGWVYVGAPSTLTRAQVIADMQRARANPVSADGWMDVGGEAGAVFVGVRESVRPNAARTAGSRAPSHRGHQNPVGATAGTPK